MKKEIIIPLFIFALGFIFILINILVFFSKGNNRLVGKKLRVGALILSLTGILACGSPQRDETCYKTVSKEYLDSIAQVKEQDSIKEAEKQKRIDDSISGVNEKRRIKDSIAKIKHLKTDPIKPTCYSEPKITCYKPARNPDTNKIK